MSKEKVKQKVKSPTRNKIKILIVENERVIAKDIKKTLENLGYSVLSILEEASLFSQTSFSC